MQYLWCLGVASKRKMPHNARQCFFFKSSPLWKSQGASSVFFVEVTRGILGDLVHFFIILSLLMSQGESWEM